MSNRKPEEISKQLKHFIEQVSILENKLLKYSNDPIGKMLLKQDKAMVICLEKELKDSIKNQREHFFEYNIKTEETDCSLEKILTGLGSFNAIFNSLKKKLAPRKKFDLNLNLIAIVNRSFGIKLKIKDFYSNENLYDSDRINYIQNFFELFDRLNHTPKEKLKEFFNNYDSETVFELKKYFNSQKTIEKNIEILWSSIDNNKRYIFFEKEMIKRVSEELNSHSVTQEEETISGFLKGLSLNSKTIEVNTMIKVPIEKPENDNADETLISSYEEKEIVIKLFTPVDIIESLKNKVDEEIKLKVLKKIDFENFDKKENVKYEFSELL